jgi:tetratricopeptide (TPR) repeat protein
MAAAAWLVFRIGELRGSAQRLKMLGCSNWNSYALFRAGVECQRSGELQRATALYARAVDADPSNNAARLNLGVIEVLNGDVDTAISRLESVEARARHDETNTDPDTILNRSSLWYQAAYNLAAARLSKADPDGSAAYAAALNLAIAIEMAREQLDKHKKPKPAARALGDFLAHIRAPAFAVLADAAATYVGTGPGG